MSTSKGVHVRIYNGDVISDRYQAQGEIGCGNFSKVYRCMDLQKSTSDKPVVVAMKILKKEYKKDATYERKMLTILSSHNRYDVVNTPRILDYFEYKGCPVFILSLHGASLRSRRLGLTKGVVTDASLKLFAYQMLRTLQFVHEECRVVHTDLKPENILIESHHTSERSIGKQWVICDYGSASECSLDNMDSDLISTRPYRAPEVIMGNKWHFASDIWSMGCILFEVAVGFRLFEVRDDLVHLHSIQCRLGKMPEMFAKGSKYSRKFFTSKGELIRLADSVREGQMISTSMKDFLRDDRVFADMLYRMLELDPDRRCTARAALAHSYFDNIREEMNEKEMQTIQTARQNRRASPAVPVSTTFTATTKKAAAAEADIIIKEPKLIQSSQPTTRVDPGTARGTKKSMIAKQPPAHHLTSIQKSTENRKHSDSPVIDTESNGLSPNEQGTETSAYQKKQTPPPATATKKRHPPPSPRPTSQAKSNNNTVRGLPERQLRVKTTPPPRTSSRQQPPPVEAHRRSDAKPAQHRKEWNDDVTVSAASPREEAPAKIATPRSSLLPRRTSSYLYQDRAFAAGAFTVSKEWETVEPNDEDYTVHTVTAAPRKVSAGPSPVVARPRHLSLSSPVAPPAFASVTLSDIDPEDPGEVQCGSMESRSRTSGTQTNQVPSPKPMPEAVYAKRITHSRHPSGAAEPASSHPCRVEDVNVMLMKSPLSPTDNTMRRAPVPIPAHRVSDGYRLASPSPIPEGSPRTVQAIPISTITRISPCYDDEEEDDAVYRSSHDSSSGHSDSITWNVGGRPLRDGLPRHDSTGTSRSSPLFNEGGAIHGGGFSESPAFRSTYAGLYPTPPQSSESGEARHANFSHTVPNPVVAMRKEGSSSLYRDNRPGYGQQQQQVAPSPGYTQDPQKLGKLKGAPKGFPAGVLSYSRGDNAKIGRYVQYGPAR